MRETWVQSLGWEDSLEEGMATHSDILACRIPMDRGAWWASVNVVSKSWTRLKRLSTAEHKERHPEEGDGGNQELEAFHFALTRPLLLRG